MTKKLIINSNVLESRIAVLEGDVLTELYLERHTKKNILSNIYKAKVSRVLPGMQSAFVNIGLSRSAFLYCADVIDPEEIRKNRQNPPVDMELDKTAWEQKTLSQRTPIEKLLKDGDEILVQVAKEPLGSKGPRVSMNISIPGHYLVLMPNYNSVGISRRIEDEDKRDALRKILLAIKPDGMGVIARTASVDVGEESLVKDLEYLKSVWQQVELRSRQKKSPAILYEEPDIVLKATRDLYSDEVSHVVIDNPEPFARLQDFLSFHIPDAVPHLEKFGEDQLIFDFYGIEKQIDKALSKKVWLPSGGFIVIDQTEALTSFDVNTGKYVGRENPRDTILKTNLEAVGEVVLQLKLRNLGGIIVIDFIDMEFAADQAKVKTALEDLLKDDKARTNVLAVNELGLVQMTRKRTSESIERSLTHVCSYCNGRGRTETVETEALKLIRDIERYAYQDDTNQLTVRLITSLKNYLDEFANDYLEYIKHKHNIDIIFEIVEPTFRSVSPQYNTYEVI